MREAVSKSDSEMVVEDGWKADGKKGGHLKALAGSEIYQPHPVRVPKKE